MPTVYMMCGIPYSGKSYYISKDKTLQKLPIVSTDNTILRIAKARGKTYNDIFKDTYQDAQDEMMSDFNRYFREKKDFIFDRTNLTVKARKRWIDMFHKNGYNVVVIGFKVPDDKTIELRRTLRRNQVIDDKILKGMKAQYQMPTMAELNKKTDKVIIVGN